jgi:hypothetical protein
MNSCRRTAACGRATNETTLRERSASRCRVNSLGRKTNLVSSFLLVLKLDESWVKRMRIRLLLACLFMAMIPLIATNATSSGVLTPPDVVIERFEAVPDCIFPDPRRGILSYRVSGGVTRVSIAALHRGGRVRPFYSQSSRSPSPSLGATNIIDSGAAAEVAGYRLVVTGAAGREARRELLFRYRAAEFALLSPVRHLRATRPFHYARYEAEVKALRVDSLACSFQFDAAIGGESGRAGDAGITTSGTRTTAWCELDWRAVSKARAAGTVEWVARVTDPCTQGRITRSARVNAIP